MDNNQKKIYVYDDFSKDTPSILGYLYIDQIRAGETYSFEYSDEWLASGAVHYHLDPELESFAGRQYPKGQNIFGMFADASPDRWGRMLLMKKERLCASLEGRKPRKLNSSDFLLGVYDKARMGGLRFKLDAGGDFLSGDMDQSIPPWANLRSLEEASRKFESDDSVKTDKWINQLLCPGSSLGGARPKATIVDTNGDLWIAKFPSRNDENNTGAWEKVASDLARLCGLNVPESKLETFSKLGSTFLVKLFDREKERRIHFASAMTLLGKTDGASAADGSSYLDIVKFINAYGGHPKRDLEELWKRIVFSMAISNTDDHLRNHAFVFKNKSWELSPMYDVNPVPYGDELSLNVNESDNRISIDLAKDVCQSFGITQAKASKLSKEIYMIVKDNWEKLAKKYDLSKSQIEDMRPAFSECE